MFSRFLFRTEWNAMSVVMYYAFKFIYKILFFFILFYYSNLFLCHIEIIFHHHFIYLCISNCNKKHNINSLKTFLSSLTGKKKKFGWIVGVAWNFKFKFKFKFLFCDFIVFIELQYCHKAAMPCNVNEYDLQHLYRISASFIKSKDTKAIFELNQQTINQQQFVSFASEQTKIIKKKQTHTTATTANEW